MPKLSPAKGHIHQGDTPWPSRHPCPWLASNAAKAGDGDAIAALREEMVALRQELGTLCLEQFQPADLRNGTSRQFIKTHLI